MDEAALQAAQTYDSYMAPALFEPWAGVLLDHAGLRAGERALDIACGSGVVTRRAAARVGPAGQVAGLDLNPAMLAVAQGHAPDEGAAPVAWHQGSAQALPFADAAFDLTVCQQGLQFFPDPAGALAEMRRVLAPGGRAALLLWQPIERNPLYQRLNEVAQGLVGAPVYAVPFRLSDPDRLRQLMGGAGFRQVELHAETREARFPSPERFVQTLTQGSAAAVPVLMAMTPEQRAELAEQVRAGAADLLSAHTQGEHLLSQMHVYIVLGQR